MTTYAYTRVSSQTQITEGESLEAQERVLTGWAMMNGTTIDVTLVEKAVSGSVPVAERPEGAAMFARLKRGDVIVAVKLDRMFRSALDALQTVEKLKDMGVGLVLLDLGGDVVSNGMSKMFLTVPAAFAEAERDRIRDRIQGAKRDAKARGRYLGGKVPFGYTVGEDGALVAVEDEQRVIARAKALRGLQQPLRTIQGTLEEEFGRRLSLDALSRITA